MISHVIIDKIFGYSDLSAKLKIINKFANDNLIIGEKK